MRRRSLAGPRRNLQLLVQAQRSLNTDARNASASLALRIYVLRDASGFEKASFDSLYDDDEATLGSNVLVRESLHLRPGEARELALELSGDARAVAVFGAFREIEHSQWRAVLPLPVGDAGAARARRRAGAPTAAGVGEVKAARRRARTAGCPASRTASTSRPPRVRCAPRRSPSSH